MKTAIVVINKQHSLMEEQEKILNSEYKFWERMNIPATGLNKYEILNLVEKLEEQKAMTSEIIILSPIPLLMKKLADNNISFRIFHNDNRNKKELPNGKIIHIVAKNGWELI